MTAREAAIVTAYTGFVCGPFENAHAYIEEIMGRPVWTHEMADREFANKIKELAKADFCALQVEPKP